MPSKHRGTRVLLVVPDRRDDGAARPDVGLAQRWTAAGCPTLQLAVDGSSALPAGRLGLPDHEARPVPHRGLRRLVPLARSADVVVADAGTGSGLVLARVLARLGGRPLVVVVRSSPAVRVDLPTRSWTEAAGRRALRGADALVCTGAHLVPDVLAAGARADAVTAVPDGDDLDVAAQQSLEVVRRAAHGELLPQGRNEDAAEADQGSATSATPSLRALVAEDLRTNHGHRFAPGFHALAVHRFGRWVRTTPRPARDLLSVAHRSMQLLVRNVYGIELPVSVELGRRVVIAHQSGIVLHPEAVIGDDVVLRHNVTIGALHGTGPGRLAPVLERGVKLAVGAVVVGPITIGEWAKIGPNAVVTQDVPAGAVVTAAEPVVRRRTPRARTGTDA